MTWLVYSFCARKDTLFTKTLKRQYTIEVNLKKLFYSFKVLCSGAKLGGGGGGEGGMPPLPFSFFENKKKCPNFRKKCPDCGHPKYLTCTSWC